MESHASSPHMQQPEPSQTQRPTWAMVIGIIAIIFGILGVIMYGLCTPAGLIMTEVFADSIDNASISQPGLSTTGAQFNAMTQFAGVDLIYKLMLAALGVVVLIGGVGLVRMRPWARTAILWWAILRLVMIIPGSVLGWYQQTAMYESMLEADAAAGGNNPGMAVMEIFASPVAIGVMISFGVVVAMALPVFALVWFTRPGIRAQMRSWQGTT